MYVDEAKAGTRAEACQVNVEYAATSIGGDTKKEMNCRSLINTALLV